MSAEHLESPQPTVVPQEITEIKEDIFSAWEELPTRDKAAVALLLLDRLGESEGEERLREAISSRWPEEIISRGAG